MQTFINKHGCLIISADNQSDLERITHWFREYKTGQNCVWVPTEKEGVQGIFYESIGSAPPKDCES